MRVHHFADSAVETGSTQNAASSVAVADQSHEMPVGVRDGHHLTAVLGDRLQRPSEASGRREHEAGVQRQRATMTAKPYGLTAICANSRGTLHPPGPAATRASRGRTPRP